MNTAMYYRATLTLATPLGTPLAGDTLFGQICWALRDGWGEAELRRRLEGYTAGHPWLVVSDGFPAGYLPRPMLPPSAPSRGKAPKKQRWIALATAATPSTTEGYANDTQAFGKSPRHTVQSRNVIDRLSGTTLSTFTQPLTWHASGQRIDLWLVADAMHPTPNAQTIQAELTQLLEWIGAAGFGRDASAGLGKFSVESLAPATLPSACDPNAWWTLAPCAPQGQGFDGANSYWRPLTRFGRHGNAAAQSGKPFKTPLLLAATGSVFTPRGHYMPRAFIGQGLGGAGQLSKAQPATVHQGYAPVLPIRVERNAS